MLVTLALLGAGLAGTACEDLKPSRCRTRPSSSRSPFRSPVGCPANGEGVDAKGEGKSMAPEAAALEPDLAWDGAWGRVADQVRAGATQILRWFLRTAAS